VQVHRSVLLNETVQVRYNSEKRQQTRSPTIFCSRAFKVAPRALLAAAEWTCPGFVER
jgi:hypothetical protein